MEDDAGGPVRKPASFTTQADALFRKNTTFLKRNMRKDLQLLMVPIFVMVLLAVLNWKLGRLEQTETTAVRCECRLCTKEMRICPAGCEIDSVLPVMAELRGGYAVCPEPHPTKWPALFLVPTNRATNNRSAASGPHHPDLPDASCSQDGTCPATVLVTGTNRTLAKRLGINLYRKRFRGASDSLDPLTVSSKYILGTSEERLKNYMEDPAFVTFDSPLYIVQRRCQPGFAFPLSINKDGLTLTKEVKCVKGWSLWRDNSSVINNVMQNSGSEVDAYLAAYDFLNTDEKNFNVTVWYKDGRNPLDLNPLRILRKLNAVSNSYLQHLKGGRVEVLLEFVKEMPKGRTAGAIAKHVSLINPLLFTWTIELLLPMFLVHLVYEKQNNLRMIMKMHGLGDRSYWIVNYAYFLSLSSAYMLCFFLIAPVTGMKLFKVPDYSVQFVFYSTYINLQIAFAILASTLFSDVKTASVVGYIYVFASGLIAAVIFLAGSLFSISRKSLQILNIVPGFALYRGIRELDQYSVQEQFVEGDRFGWMDVTSDKEGLLAVMLMMMAEYPLLLLLASYIDQVGSNGTGVRKHPLWFLPCFNAKICEQTRGYDVLVSMENHDVSQEREKVERLVRESNNTHVVICNDLQKVYPRRDGNPPKHAVRGLSLALPRGECFGMLGPNGAGKTSFISMMTGLTTPTAGTAYIQGLDIRKDMDEVYTRMGLCPQHDLIWDKLTGREHLLFYGRLKNLKGTELTEAVQKTLGALNLLDKADKLAGQYSGGMKRRLSVAISLIGDPIVVYMDEPSTGLDPASRKSLWSIVQNAKKDKAIILTTHSMEEAEFLCDRVGIFIDGNLKCIGHPKELKSRYGGYLVLTMTTPPDQEDEVEKMVKNLSQQARKVYRIPGTQKFHLPKEEVKLASVLKEIENAKSRISIQAWGLADTTLEDVFVKVAKGHSQSPN